MDAEPTPAKPAPVPPLVKPAPVLPPPPVAKPVPAAPAAKPAPAATEPPAPPPEAVAPAAPPRKGGWLRLVIGAVAVAVALAYGIPWIIHGLNTVSTDDAYVNSYVTFVAPRVAGQVTRVLVDDNNRVKKGDVLVELDPEPYQVQVNIKQAAVDAAQADLVLTEANLRALIAQVRGERFTLQHTIENVDDQVALLHSAVAKWDQSKATLVLAQSELDRDKNLIATKAISAEDLDEKQAALDVAKAQVNQTLQDALEARANLGLPITAATALDDASLNDVPSDLDQTFSTVRVALADLWHGAGQLGIVPSSYNLTPKETVDEFYRRDPQGNIDRIYAQVIKDAPALKQAQVAVEQAQRDLDEANLNLRYCKIVSEIDGVVTRRNVNPGDNVLVGQSLMAVRSLHDIWIDANFKETQLRKLRIGQHVNLETDIYGRHLIFEGRISGFTNGTGSTLALLPAQNATGNFVKVVQRLPVRIDVLNYDPDKLPLFVGLSVTPTVDLKAEPTGPNAGQYLQAALPTDSDGTPTLSEP